MELLQLRDKIVAQLDVVHDLALLQEIEQLLVASAPRSAEEKQFVSGLLKLDGFADPAAALQEAELQTARGEFVTEQEVLDMLRNKVK
jgi:hypothetical protein